MKLIDKIRKLAGINPKFIKILNIYETCFSFTIIPIYLYVIYYLLKIIIYHLKKNFNLHI